MADRFRHTAGWNRRGFEGAVAGRDFVFHRLGGEGPNWARQIKCGLSPEPGGWVDPSNIESLIAFLRENEGCPAASRALAALKDGLLPSGCVELLHGTVNLEAGLSHFYAADDTGLRVAVALRYPAVFRVLSHIWPYSPGPDERDPARLLRHLLRRHAPDASPGSIRGVMAYGRCIGSTTLLDALLGLPPERHPQGEAERDRFEMIVTASERIRQMLGGYGHLVSARHGWAEFADLIARHLSVPPTPGPLAGDGPPAARQVGTGSIDRACLDTVDIARAFAHQVILPLLSEAGMADEDRLLAFAGVGSFDRHVSVPGATKAAARILFAGKSLPAILELSARWHRAQRRMDGEIHAVTPAEPGVPRPRANAWPVPFHPLEAPNGLSIVFLEDMAQLSAEGCDVDAQGVPGLHHCVAGYGPECASGRSAIASVRSVSAGTFRRLATVEVKLAHDGIRIAQARGPFNADAPAVAKDAVAWLVGEVKAGRLAPDPGYMGDAWRTNRIQTVADLCGYDHAVAGATDAVFRIWAPLLIRPLRAKADLFREVATQFRALEPRDREPSMGRLPLRIASDVARGIGLCVVAFPFLLGQLVAMWGETGRVASDNERGIVVAALLGEAGLLTLADYLGAYAIVGILAAQVALIGWNEARTGYRTMGVLRTSLRNVLRAGRINASLRGLADTGTAHPASAR